jgi:hypothetical protein
MNGRLLSRVLAAVALFLAAASLSLYLSDQRQRAPGETFLRSFDVPARRPAEAATLALLPAADLAANVVGDIAMSDALGVVQLDQSSPEQRERWLRAAMKIDDELLAARDIQLDAAAARPGWAMHWSLLGRLTYTWQRRHPLETRADEMRQWLEPLRFAARYGAGNQGTATALASALLERWPEIPADARKEARPVFSAALADAEFATAALPIVIEAVGRDEALSLLPDEPRTLRAAFTALAARDDFPAAVAMYRLWESAEWRARTRDLEALEERLRLRDADALRRMTFDWMQAHPAPDFDSPGGRKQVIRVLQLTMNDREGLWQRDVRASVLRFLLDHRMRPGRSSGSGIETVPGGSAAGEAMSALDAVPDPIRARARLLAGDVFGAESLLQRSDSAGSLEWTPFLVDLARFRLLQNMPDSAQAALDNLAPLARNECEVTLVRRELDALRGMAAQQEQAAGSAQLPPTAWSQDGQLSLCIDPATARTSYLTTTLEAPAPALIMYGWNGGRRATVEVPRGRTRLTVPLADLWGRNAFFVKTLAGGPVKPANAELERR